MKGRTRFSGDTFNPLVNQSQRTGFPPWKAAPAGSVCRAWVLQGGTIVAPKHLYGILIILGWLFSNKTADTGRRHLNRYSWCSDNLVEVTLSEEDIYIREGQLKEIEAGY